jgi:uncharacterized protein
MRYPHSLIAKPKLTLLIWLAVMGLMAVSIVLWPQIQINPTFKSMIMPNDGDRAFDLESKQIFGDDEIIIIAVEHPETVFNIDTLAKIDRITRQVKDLGGVRDVYSLTHVDNIRDRNGVLDTSDLIEELPTTPEDLQRIEKEADDNPVYWNSIVSPDKKVAAINVEPSLSRSDTRSRGELTEKVLAIARAENQDGEEKIYVTGFPVSSYFGGIYMITDMVIFGGVATVLLMIILWFIFRNAQGIVFTLLVGMLGVSVTYGVMSLAGVQITMPLSAVMVFVMALGMEYSIYVGYAYITETLEERKQGREASDHTPILTRAVRGVSGAVALSAVTTSIGFLSMLTNPVPDLAKMGLFLAVGTLTVGIASLTVVPAVIALWPFEVKAKAEPRLLANRVVSKIGGGAARHPGRAILVMGVLLSLCFVGWAQMSLDTDAMQYFKKSDTIRTDEEFVRARMAGTTYLQAVITATERDAFKKPENLRKLAELQDYAESLPHVTKAMSHADHVRLLHRALRGESEAYTIPDSQAAVEQLLLLHKEPDDFRMVIDFEYQRASVMVRMNTMSSTRLKDTEALLETRMKELFPGMGANVVGTTLLVHRAFDMMASSMLTGLAIACGLIWLIMCVVFRSVKLGTLALLPNIVPIALIYSVLGWIGYPLDPPTAVTGAIALGIAVDDTIHFFKSWLRHVQVESMSSSDAVVATLQKIGRPMVMSSLVLAFGFGVMILSSYGTLLWLGVMLCIGAVSGLVCDLLLTPAILSLARIPPGKPPQEEATKAP